MLRLSIEAWGQPSTRKIEQVVAILRKGGVAAYPTDSVYALGCAIDATDARARIAQMKRMNKHQRLALICSDLPMVSRYALLSQTAFRLAQRIFPGPYTLVLPATRQVPRTLADDKRRTVGIRITSHPVPQAIVALLTEPLLTTTAEAPLAEAPCMHSDEVLECFGKQIDVLIDSESHQGEPSTVLEVEGDDIRVLREGQGKLDGII